VDGFDGECKRVGNALMGDIEKALTQGKAVIIEGVHVRRALLDATRDARQTLVGTGNAIIVCFILSASSISILQDDDVLFYILMCG
jgi:2-phosphoglycerate kinase